MFELAVKMGSFKTGALGQALGSSQPLITSITGGKNVVQMWQGRSCMNCHTKVHGSNNPSATNPTPQFMLRAEVHWVDGTGFLAAQDNPNSGALRRYWDNFMLQASFRF